MHVGSKSIVFSFVFVTFALLISHAQEAHAQSMVVRMHGTGEARLADPSMGENRQGRSVLTFSSKMSVPVRTLKWGEQTAS